MNKHILITGHTRGLGNAITRKLLDTNNFHIVGISRTSACLNHPLITEISADLSDEQQTLQLQNVLSKYHFDAVILNAGANNIKPPEAYTPQEIQKIIQLNFTSNAVLIKMCLNGLLKNKGHIIGIGSYSGIEVKKWNNFYGSAKAGLHHLLRNLFEQYRRQELKVSIVIPDIMYSDFYHHQEYQPLSEKEYALQINDVAEIISQWIICPPNYVPFEIVLRPQMFQLLRKN